MAVSLTKGGNINLSDQDGELRSISIGLGWDARTTDGAPFDLDASAFMLGSSEKVTTDDDFVFYGSYHRTEDGITVFVKIVLPINDTRSTLNFSKLL